MIKRLFYFLCPLVTIIIKSCNLDDSSEKLKDIIVDSTLSKLNSPELKGINLKLLQNPNNSDLYFQRAEIYYKNQDLEAAKNDAIRAIKIDSLKTDYFILLSDIYFTANETRLAKENLEKCIRINPNSIDANLKLAELFFYVKKYQEAINYSNNALKINDITSKAYFIKGMCYKESADTTNAISSFQTAIEQDNNLIDAYLELGIIFTKKKNPLAIEYFKSALNIDPKNEDILYNMAYFYQLTSNYTTAVDIYKKILNKNINYKEAHYNLGSIEILKNKNYNQAIKHFSNAINSDANYAEAFFARGVCYEELKDKINAKADYQMALQINPKNEFAIENLNQLEK